MQRIKDLFRSRFLRNVAIVATGTAGAQAITMAFMPVITRLYGPEAFGFLGTFLAILAVLTPIAALTYPIAMVLPKKDRDAIGLAKLSIAIAAVMAVVCAGILLIFGSGIVQLLNVESIKAYLWLVPVAMLLAAVMQVLQQWLIRTKQFRITARVAMLQALTLNSAKAGAGFFYPIGGALIVLATAGSGWHAFLLWLEIRRKKLPLKDERDETPTSLKELAKRHRDFPIFRAPQVTINAASQSLPVLMLASFFGPAAAGLYTLSRTAMAVPSGLIGKSVFDVFYPRITEAAHNHENLFRLILKASLALAAAGIVPFGFIILFGPWLFGFVFGAEWHTAGEYAQWLALWLFCSFLNRPSVAAIATLGKQGFFLVYEIVSIGLRILALYVGFIFFQDDLTAIALFSVVGAILNLYLVGKTLAIANKLDAGAIYHQ